MGHNDGSVCRFEDTMKILRCPRRWRALLVVMAVSVICDGERDAGLGEAAAR